MNNYVQQTLDSMRMVAENARKDIHFDKTILCSVVSAVEDSDIYYWVSDGDTKFKAKITNEDDSYYEGDKVYVTVQQGDWSKDKLITGKFLSDKGEINLSDGIYLDAVKGNNFSVIDRIDAGEDTSRTLEIKHKINTYQLYVSDDGTFIQDDDKPNPEENLQDFLTEKANYSIYGELSFTRVGNRISKDKINSDLLNYDSNMRIVWSEPYESGINQYTYFGFCYIPNFEIIVVPNERNNLEDISLTIYGDSQVCRNSTILIDNKYSPNIPINKNPYKDSIQVMQCIFQTQISNMPEDPQLIGDGVFEIRLDFFDETATLLQSLSIKSTDMFGSPFGSIYNGEVLLPIPLLQEEHDFLSNISYYKIVLLHNGRFSFTNEDVTLTLSKFQLNFLGGLGEEEEYKLVNANENYIYNTFSGGTAASDVTNYVYYFPNNDLNKDVEKNKYKLNTYLYPYFYEPNEKKVFGPNVRTNIENPTNFTLYFRTRNFARTTSGWQEIFAWSDIQKDFNFNGEFSPLDIANILGYDYKGQITGEGDKYNYFYVKRDYISFSFGDNENHIPLYTFYSREYVENKEVTEVADNAYFKGNQYFPIYNSQTKEIEGSSTYDFSFQAPTTEEKSKKSLIEFHTSQGLICSQKYCPKDYDPNNKENNPDFPIDQTSFPFQITLPNKKPEVSKGCIWVDYTINRNDSLINDKKTISVGPYYLYYNNQDNFLNSEFRLKIRWQVSDYECITPGETKNIFVSVEKADNTSIVISDYEPDYKYELLSAPSNAIQILSKDSKSNICTIKCNNTKTVNGKEETFLPEGSTVLKVSVTLKGINYPIIDYFPIPISVQTNVAKQDQKINYCFFGEVPGLDGFILDSEINSTEDYKLFPAKGIFYWFYQEKEITIGKTEIERENSIISPIKGLLTATADAQYKLDLTKLTKDTVVNLKYEIGVEKYWIQPVLFKRDPRIDNIIEDWDGKSKIDDNYSFLKTLYIGRKNSEGLYTGYIIDSIYDGIKYYRNGYFIKEIGVSDKEMEEANNQIETLNKSYDDLTKRVQELEKGE